MPSLNISIPLPGVPPLLNQISNFADISKIVTIPNITNILRVPSISAMQLVPSITQILKIASPIQIPSIPNISQLLNVPSLSALTQLPSISSLLKLPSITSLQSFDALDLLGDSGSQGSTMQQAPQWGIFLGAEIAIEMDSFVSYDYKRDWNLPTYPIENGGFETYNKVNFPFDVHVTITRGGSATDIQDFLSELESIGDALSLFNVVTPERVYQNCNVLHFDYSRSAKHGVSLITAEIWFQQIRVANDPVFSNTAEPSAQSPINIGNVQAQVTATAKAAVVNALNHGVSGAW